MGRCEKNDTDLIINIDWCSCTNCSSVTFPFEFLYFSQRRLFPFVQSVCWLYFLKLLFNASARRSSPFSAHPVSNSFLFVVRVHNSTLLRGCTKEARRTFVHVAGWNCNRRRALIYMCAAIADFIWETNISFINHFRERQCKMKNSATYCSLFPNYWLN